MSAGPPVSGQTQDVHSSFPEVLNAAFIPVTNGCSSCKTYFGIGNSHQGFFAVSGTVWSPPHIRNESEKPYFSQNLQGCPDRQQHAHPAQALVPGQTTLSSYLSSETALRVASEFHPATRHSIPPSYSSCLAPFGYLLEMLNRDVASCQTRNVVIRFGFLSKIV